jgi:hypothetical protein
METVPFDPATDLRPGDRVKVNGKAARGPDHSLIGRPGTFLRYSPHRGYAHVQFDHDQRNHWLILPGNLDREEATR